MVNTLFDDFFTEGWFTSNALHHVRDEYMNEVAQRWAPLKPTEVFATYWYFAFARQRLFFRRLAGQEAPWTEDPILESHRFTNAYRASDRVSQFLIRQVLYPEEINNSASPNDILFRTLLFKIFNRVETWQLLETSLGEISWQRFSFESYDAVLTAALQRKQAIFSGAYIMPGGQSSFGSLRKHRNYLSLLEWIMKGGRAENLLACKSLKAIYYQLRDFPLLGDFLAFQYAIDLNYSPLFNLDENSYVVAGPGARDGIVKCFTNAHLFNPEKVIALMAERQSEEFKLIGLPFQSLWGRPLQLIDCQNLFCEVGKYARVAHPAITGTSGRTRIKQTYRSCAVQPLPEPLYPPSWGINERVKSSVARAQYQNIATKGTEYTL